ncbi:MAG: hypothetical protein EBR40_10710 [Proteobacteria bacterium]|nr:hypothetical protein [Pseudomonadota bacterium]
MLFEFVDRILDRQPLRISEENGVVRYRVGYGTTDAEQILSVLSRLISEYGVDPRVRRFTTSLFSDSVGNDDRSGQVRAITSFMEDNVRYVRDPLGVEYVRSPVAMLDEYEKFGMANGDCDDQVLLSGSMLHSIGFAVRPVGLHLYDSEYHDHVALQIQGDRGIVNYDPCNPSNPFGEPKGDILPGRFAPENA